MVVLLDVGWCLRCFLDLRRRIAVASVVFPKLWLRCGRPHYLAFGNGEFRVQGGPPLHLDVGCILRHPGHLQRVLIGMSNPSVYER